MKAFLKLCFSFLAVMVISCSGDDGPGQIAADDDPPGNLATTVSFRENYSIDENGSFTTVTIDFDQAAITAGEIRIKLHHQQDLEIQTIPEVLENIITLQVKEDDESISFQLAPVDDNVIKGMKNISLTFDSMSSGFRKADNNGLTITVIDDELKGMPKSLNENIIYHYREDGKIKKIEYKAMDMWDYSENYFYSEDGLIEKINEDYLGSEKLYFWEDQKIVRSEERFQDELILYSIYEYDPRGNISKNTQTGKNGQGEFVLQYLYEYEYFEDGNLHKILVYIPSNTKPANELVASYIYDDYLEVLNPFPLNEIIPTIPVHKNLYSSLESQDGWGYAEYNYTYEFNVEGKPIKQLINENVVMTFEYY
ncbi:hypothetical protein C8P64_2881 [Christiangramia gaetbulicola]|uniref:YD repeat-containing protein n=1 Tax=Christiangramia gaetbulicola TaxID=703340 RepID=A0A2T6AF56_9FLAO|nr:hypothetical protein [Christiangramia gaetbulicola]PTX42452.1 hypothetical protein C8P64_2881 [Christiangramia gaetbulicola]